MAKQRSSKIAKQVAQRIKELRLRNHITQEQFLFDTGIHIGRMETQPKHFQIDTIKKICDYLGISLKEFFSEGFE